MTPLQRIATLRRIRKTYKPIMAIIAVCSVFIFSRVQRVQMASTVIEPTKTIIEQKPRTQTISQAHDTQNPR